MDVYHVRFGMLQVNEARGAKDTLGILFRGICLQKLLMHKLTAVSESLLPGRHVNVTTGCVVEKDLQLEDVEGVDCLPNATIFEQLALMRLVVQAQEKPLWDTIAQTRFGNVSKLSNDPLSSCLDKTRPHKAEEDVSLERRRVKKLERHKKEVQELCVLKKVMLDIREKDSVSPPCYFPVYDSS
ncbi:hypothetical protein Tco_0576865 [Tanacetum coccineum]